MKRKQLNTRIPEKLRIRLMLWVKDSGMKVSSVVKKALEEYLRGYREDGE